MKKIVTIVILGFFSLYFIAMNYNNFKLDKFAKQLDELEFPKDIVAIETNKICGKLNGNGNSMDYLACILVKTKRSKVELCEFWNNINFNCVDENKKSCVEKEVVQVDGEVLQSKFLQHEIIEFESLSSETEFCNYYVMVIYDGGYSSDFDIRGH